MICYAARDNLKQSFLPETVCCCNKNLKIQVLALEPHRVETAGEVRVGRTVKKLILEARERYMLFSKVLKMSEINDYCNLEHRIHS